MFFDDEIVLKRVCKKVWCGVIWSAVRPRVSKVFKMFPFLLGSSKVVEIIVCYFFSGGRNCLNVLISSSRQSGSG